MARSKLMQMESALYLADKWAWSIYTALRHAPNKKAKAALWALLTHEQQEALRVLARQPAAGPREAAGPYPEDQPPAGPTYDHYGKRL